MRFGAKLQSSIFEPWKDSYLHYSHLKTILYEGRSGEDWGERDESRFVEQLDSELEKVISAIIGQLTVIQIYAFQHDISQELETKIGEIEEEVDGLMKKDAPIDERIKIRIEKQLDEIVDEIKELEKFSRVNFTGFMKVDRFYRLS